MRDGSNGPTDQMVAQHHVKLESTWLSMVAAMAGFRSVRAGRF